MSARCGGRFGAGDVPGFAIAAEAHCAWAALLIFRRKPRALVGSDCPALPWPALKAFSP